jgi:hypothetical protein
MAKDDTSPGGLFSKMVKFVRSPGTQWNELDDPSSAKEGSLSKQALKEMIERKRRNDFVRKREFDMLRKLRNRELTGAGASGDSVARPSFFQSSMPSRPDDRAMTLKKIDEIEAQMSMQWWKTKHGAAGDASSLNQASDFTASNISSKVSPNSMSSKSAVADNALAFARTAPDALDSSVAHSANKSPNNAAAASPVPGAARGLPSSAQKPTNESAASSVRAKPGTAEDHNSLDFTSDAPAAGKPIHRVHRRAMRLKRLPPHRLSQRHRNRHRMRWSNHAI